MVNADSAASRLPRAALWNLVDLSGRQIVQLLAVVVLARLLSPSDFGVVAIAMLFVAIGSVLSEGGVSTALIQRPVVDAAAKGASLTINVVLGTVACGALVSLAPAAAAAYEQDVLRPLLTLMAPAIVMSALAATPMALLTRDLRFRSIALAGLTSTLTGGAAAIVLASSGAGVYALGVQTLVASTVNMVTLNVLCRWDELARPSLAALREIWVFGGFVLIATLLEVTFSRLYAGFISRTEGVHGVGLYARADSSQQLLSGLIGNLIWRLSLPVFSRSAGNHDELKLQMRKAAVLLMGVNVPLMGVLSALATPVMVMAFGLKWADAGVLLSILALAGVLLPLQVINLNVVLAMGRPRVYLTIEVIKKVLGIPMIIGASHFGAVQVAWAYFGYAILSLMLNSTLSSRTLGYSALEQLRDVRACIVVVAPISGLLYLASSAWDVPAVVQVFTLGPAGLLTVLLFYRLARLECWKLIVHSGIRVLGGDGTTPHDSSDHST